MRAVPSRAGRMDLKVDVPAGLQEDQRAGLLEAIEHCTVSNTLRVPPSIDIAVHSPVR